MAGPEDLIIVYDGPRDPISQVKPKGAVDDFKTPAGGDSGFLEDTWNPLDTSGVSVGWG